MAPALECPACGMRHPLGALVPDTTFRCERCGQKLLVPSATAVASATAGSGSAAPAPPGGAPRPPARSGAPAPPATDAAPPPPRRRGSPTDVPAAAAAAGVAVTVSANGDDGPPPGAESRRSRRRERPERRRVHWYWRLLAWVVAVPLAFLIAVVPSYELGLISKDDVLDVFVGSGTDRYVRLAAVTLIWAVVTAILVQLFVEVGRSWAARRRRRAGSSGGGRRGGGAVAVGSA